MGILFNTAIFHQWQVIVYDVHNVADINAAGCHSSRDENGSLAGSESSHSGFSFNLCAVTVDGSDW